MSVLARLVARATGQASPGLAPHLPGRFETVPGDWSGSFEVQERNAAAPPPAGETVRPRMDAPPRPPSLAAGEESAQPGPERPRSLISERAAAVDPARVPPLDAASADPPRHDGPRALESAEPPPDRTKAPAGPAAEGTERPGPMMPRRAAPEGAPFRWSAEIVAAPEPLLPDAPPTLDRAMRPDPPDRAQRPPFQAPPFTRAGRVAPAEPPEITVHIGRIDVVASSEERKAPRRPESRRPQMTALGDYLRGRERSG